MIDAIPSEFAGFVRDTGVRAFDRLAEHAKELDPALRSFIRAWSRLSETQKVTLFDQLIAAARFPSTETIEPPAGMRQKKPIKRYDPEDVAATLPKKPARKPARKAAKKKTKTKKTTSE
ncbi:MAG TPA: hypothetical protein VF057_02150 [Thermoanaerobaculia bacterium]